MTQPFHLKGSGGCKAVNGEALLQTEHSLASVPEKSRKRKARQGQNLVELALTLPFVMLMLFFIVELGRAWYAYEGAKMAAMEGAHTAAIYQNPAVGKQQLDSKLAAAGLNVVSSQVQQVANQHAYAASVTVSFSPFFSGLSIPTLTGPVSIIPNQFNITYNAIQDVSVY